MYKYSQNFVRPQGRWGGGTFGRKVQRWLGGSEGEWAVCKPLVGGSFKNKPNMGGGETFRVPSPWLENFEPGPKSCQT